MQCHATRAASGRSRIPLLLLASLGSLIAGDLNAHGGSDETLYVAESGTDRDRCLEPRAPCRTLGYALSVAGKGSRVQLAPGTYAVADSSDLFHVVSGMIDVVGGIEPGREFLGPPQGVAILTGVPAEYRELLRDRGLHVIADRKNIDGPSAAEAEKFLSLHRQLKSGAAVSPCVGGMAGSLECESVDLLAHFSFADISTPPSSTTDVWGFVDLNSGREYVIVGYNIGTAVIDVTDPENPVEVGFIDGQRAGWRDIKVYQFFDAGERRWRAYAYVTTDGSSDGLFVIDLSGLPHSVRKTGHVSDYVSAHNVYATNTDYRTGLALTDGTPTLVIAGSNLGSGRYRAYSLANPATPAFVGGASAADYMHDAASMIVTDSRKDSQCVNGGAYCEVMIDFNEQHVDIWDVTDAAQPSRLSRTPYSNATYVHSGWLAEDRQHLFVHDELDEQQRGLQTTLRVFSLANLAAPVQVGTWTGPTSAIDHNGFVRGNRYYMSNYSRGLTILDISNPADPVTVGRLDTYPFSDNTAFVGAWGVYPYLSGGTVAISDIDTGLYLARDRSIDVAQGKLAFTAISAGAAEGQTVQLAVQRTGGTTGAVSVGVEVLHATTDGSDIGSVTDTLSWAGGVSGNQVVSVPLANDGVDEGLELLFVRLVNPQGGASLGELNVAGAYLSDPGSTSQIRFFSDSIEIAERGFATAVVVLQRIGSADGAASVDYVVVDGTANAGSDFDGNTSGTVSWPDGDATPKNLLFRVADDGTGEDTEFFDVELGNAGGAAISGSTSLRVTIADGRGSNTAPNAVAGSSQIVAANSVVTLNGSQSSDSDGDSLDFEWQQISGPSVTLNNAGAADATFTAPSVSSDTMLQFRLTVSDPSGLSDSATVTVTVTRPSDANGGDSGGGAVNAWLLAWLLAAAGVRFSRRGVALRSSVRGRAPSK
jgi:choice-of-anchor B domain-containing protein